MGYMERIREWWERRKEHEEWMKKRRQWEKVKRKASGYYKYLFGLIILTIGKSCAYITLLIFLFWIAMFSSFGILDMFGVGNETNELNLKDIILVSSMMGGVWGIILSVMIQSFPLPEKWKKLTPFDLLVVKMFLAYGIFIVIILVLAKVKGII